MPRLPSTALRVARRWPVAVVWLLSLAFTAWVIALIVLRLSAPSPLAVSPPPLPTAEEAAQKIALAALFDGKPAVAGEATAAPAQFRLIGVATGFGIWPGFALLQPAGEDAARAVALGDELAPGVKLVALNADTAEIERNGSRETLPLSRDNAAVVSEALTATPRPTAMTAPPQQQIAPPAPPRIAPAGPRIGKNRSAPSSP